jgi:short subunit dehydrogenase-like uncharacterized protein
MSDREYDVVLFGATGFTGTLTAQYLARAVGAPGAPATRWAIAGRNRGKLEAVRSGLAEIDPGAAQVALLEADINDPASIRTVAESAKVVISTVGPYIFYGEPVVAACAAAGTDYVDLTGEPEFVDRMWLGYHDQAQRSGARLIHSCGFDSIPYDLGALFTVGQLPEGVPIRLAGYVQAGATFSGGTYHSAINIMGRLRQGAIVARQRKQREAGPSGRRVRGIPGKPHRSAVAGGWVLPFPTIDPQTVLRSARALDRYGPDFSYSHYLVAKQFPVLAGLMGGAGAVIALAQLPPTRKLLLKLKDPGEGPTAQQREKSWFKVKFAARAGDPLGIQPRPSGSRPRHPAAGDPLGERVVTQVSGGDPGYGETSKMLAESALCLAHDDLPQRAGQLTPAVAMGQVLIDRLIRAGIRFDVLE